MRFSSGKNSSGVENHAEIADASWLLSPRTQIGKYGFSAFPPRGLMGHPLSVFSDFPIRCRVFARTDVPRQSENRFSNLCRASTNQANDFGSTGSNVMTGSLLEEIGR